MYVIVKTIKNHRYFFNYTIDTNLKRVDRWEGLEENATKISSTNLDIILNQLRKEPDGNLITFTKVAA